MRDKARQLELMFPHMPAASQPRHPAKTGRRIALIKPSPCASRFSTVAATRGNKRAYLAMKKYTQTPPKTPPEPARPALPRAPACRSAFARYTMDPMSRAPIRFATVSFTLLGSALYAQQAGGRGAGAGAQAGGPPPTIEQRTAGMQKLDGFFPLYWDERTGNLFLEIPRFDSDFLYATGLAAGLGSNDIGLDRGQEGGGRIVSFQRVGPRVLMVQPNQSFRSSSANPAERRSVADSFARSILWGFTVAAESNGRVLVDATDFVLRDGDSAGNALQPGPYRVDRTRSAIYLPRTKAFPKNTEIEVTLTFANEATGGRGGGGGGPAQGPPPIVVAAPAVAAAAAGPRWRPQPRAPAVAGAAQAASAEDSSPEPWPA
ncbi:hypothetical protein SBA6_750006 [Candidatus Sulfopaludibacter sp. SbA6]|nr:hypothetical protein SBA6_750006 [Candidatus Sulfopaludibacter sp. SbA6]